MKKKKAWKVVLPCILAVCVCGGVAVAAYNVTVHNLFQTGAVDIELNTYRVDENGKESSQTDVTGVLPGQKISNLSRVTNHGADCYVRAKVDYDLEGMEHAEYGLGEHWKPFEDGYYYYTEMLAHGEDTDIFEGFILPKDGTQEEYADKTFHQNITVDSIQSENFTPDWKSQTPWGSVNIQANTKDAAVEMESVSKKNVLQIRFDGNSKNLFAEPDDFFANFGTVMPGDTFTETVTLKNDGTKDMKLYFTQAEKNSDLLKETSLTISTDGQMVYDGTLSEAVSNKVAAELKGGSQKEMTFTVSVPAELDNRYALQKEQIDWTFSTDEQKPEGIKTIVQTGDLPWIYLFAGAGLLFIGMGVRVIRRKEETE